MMREWKSTCWRRLFLACMGLAFVGVARPEVVVLVKDLREGPDSSYLRLLTPFQSKVYFRASGTHGSGLWGSDGTGNGTQFVAAFAVEQMAVADDRLFVQARPFSQSEEELWISDGTPSGTRQHNPLELDEDTVFVEFQGVGDAGPILYFTAQDELWKSDRSGSAQVKDTCTGTWFFPLEGLTAGRVDGGPYRYLFFVADTKGGSTFADAELFRSDGTEAGTVLVRDIHPGSGTFDSSSPENLINVNGRLFFTADDGEHGRELWTSDGTRNGTYIVKDIVPGADDPSMFYEFASSGGKLFFVPQTSARLLWVSDGTTVGTRAIISKSGVGQLVDLDGTLLFSMYGQELWRSNGTAAGTVLVRQIPGALPSSYLTAMTNVNGTLYFTANGNEIWRSDGTAAGTVLVYRFPNSDAAPSEFVAAGDRILFSATASEVGRELWALVPDGSGLAASGRATLSGETDHSGVTISFSLVSGEGVLPRPVTTDAGGAWNQAAFEAGVTYRATPQKANWAFTPSARDFTAPAAGLDFAGTPSSTYTVAGAVTLGSLADHSGVMVAFSRVSGSGAVPTPVVTDAGGAWSQAGFEIGTTYRVTPDLAGWFFTPSFRDFNAPTESLDFVGIESGSTAPRKVFVYGVSTTATNPMKQSFLDDLGAMGHTVTHAQTFPADPAPYDVLVITGESSGSPLANVPTVDLDNYVSAGGGVVLFEGAIRDGLVSAAAQCNPVALSFGWEERTNTTVANPASPLARNLAQTSTLTGWTFNLSLKPGADVAVRWQDTVPMGVTYTHGNGKVVFFNDLSAWYRGPGESWTGDHAYGYQLMKNAIDWMVPPPTAAVRWTLY